MHMHLLLTAKIGHGDRHKGAILMSLSCYPGLPPAENKYDGQGYKEMHDILLPLRHDNSER